MKKKYQIKDGAGWVTVKKGQPTEKGWLHYELVEGKGLDASTVIGLAKPGEWREKPATKKVVWT